MQPTIYLDLPEIGVYTDWNGKHEDHSFNKIGYHHPARHNSYAIKQKHNNYPIH